MRRAKGSGQAAGEIATGDAQETIAVVAEAQAEGKLSPPSSPASSIDALDGPRIWWVSCQKSTGGWVGELFIADTPEEAGRRAWPRFIPVARDEHCALFAPVCHDVTEAAEAAVAERAADRAPKSDAT